MTVVDIGTARSFSYHPITLTLTLTRFPPQPIAKAQVVDMEPFPAGWYVRLLRDEVLAEWQLDGPSPTLHVHCHVSGQERWLAPPHLRNYIFKREMALVRKSRPALPILLRSPDP